MIRGGFRRRRIVALPLAVVAGAVVLAIFLSSGGGKPKPSRQEQALALKLAPMIAQMESHPKQRQEILRKLQMFAKTLRVDPVQLESLARSDARLFQAKEKKAAVEAPARLKVTHVSAFVGRMAPALASRAPLGQVNDVSFLNAKTGFLVAFESTGTNVGTAVIEKTTDGGSSWTTVWSRRHTSLGWIGFSDPRHLFALGTANSPAGKAGALLFKSDDGGRSWKEIKPILPRSGPKTPTNFAPREFWWSYELQFPDGDKVGFAQPNPDNVWDLIGPAILRTGDGGEHWTAMQPSKGVSFTVADFLDAEHGFATGIFSGRRARSCPSAVFATGDSGRHWRLLRGSCTRDSLTSVDALSASLVFAGGGQPYYFSAGPQGIATVIASSDGGQTWHRLSRGSGEPIVVIRFFDRKHGFAASGGCKMGANGPCGGELMTTADGGRSWKYTSVEAGRLVRAGEKAAWVVPPCEGSCDVIFRSHNRGASWQPVARPENLGLRTVEVVGKDLYLTSEAGTFESSDGGASWHSFIPPEPPGVSRYPDYPYEPAPVSAPGVFATPLGTNKVAVSHDNGRSWHRAIVPGSKQTGLAAIAFADSLHGFAVGQALGCGTSGEQASLLSETFDGGRSWHDLRGNGMTIDQIAAVPGIVVVTGEGALCNQSVVGISRDGGRTWAKSLLPKGASCTASLEAPETVWLSCGDYMLLSSDGGASWSKLVGKHLEIGGAPGRGEMGWLMKQTWVDGRATATLWHTGDGGGTWSEVWPKLPLVSRP